MNITVYDFVYLLKDDQEVSIYDMNRENVYGTMGDIVWKGLSQDLMICPYANDSVYLLDTVNGHININIRH